MCGQASGRRSSPGATGKLRIEADTAVEADDGAALLQPRR
jgi:hypothetical protein